MECLRRRRCLLCMSVPCGDKVPVHLALKPFARGMQVPQILGGQVNIAGVPFGHVDGDTKRAVLLH